MIKPRVVDPYVKYIANKMVDACRVVLMDADTDCGEEILCTMIAKRCTKEIAQQLIDHRAIVLRGQDLIWEIDHYGDE